ncbi:ABC transporter ATP-binding protein [Serratia sp. DD3]|uniref:ABC transporter ATP-binding protein n=1 Tax=Serratia sp. DD3 TaxID=1410619 RepID=UPI0003C508FD|nr:ABC transporter ATP-binding protein [Serratia sp. DD3]KEY57917.1 trehalose import ATP-binding protein SugC [Serratia sp. DD3]
MAELHIRQLNKSYGKQHILQDLDLHVRDGEFLTLLGASGCGKSTLLKLIAGLETVDSGSIHMDGENLLTHSPGERDCAMVFQSYALYPHMTVGQNIQTPLWMRQLTALQRLPGASWFSGKVRKQRAQIESEARKVADLLGLNALWSRRPAELSGGQRQRVALARAMVRRPQVFLFDEPLSNLDAHLRQSLRAEIRQLHDTLGATFIYVTHDQHEAMSMSDRVALMREGKVLQLGTPQEIYRTPVTLEVARFVGSPRINTLPALVDNQGIVVAQGQPIGQTSEIRGACQLAFRPNAAQPSLHTATTRHPHLQLSCQVRSVEYTGAEQVLTLRMPVSAENYAEPLIACLPANMPAFKPGQSISLRIEYEDLHLFDAQGSRVNWQVLPQLTAMPVASLLLESAS